MILNDFLKKEIRFIKGVGPIKGQLFNKLDIYTIKDIIEYRPFRYDDLSVVTNVCDYDDNQNKLYFLKILDKRVVNSKNYKIIKLRAIDNTSYCDIVFFNQDYLKNKFDIGKKYYFFGKFKNEFNSLTLNSPDFYKENELKEKILPVYLLTAGLSLNYFRKVIKNVLNELNTFNFEEIIPEFILKKYLVENYKKSIFNIHFPDNFENCLKSLKDLKFREIFTLHLAFSLMKEKKSQKNNIKWINDFDLIKFEVLLPFKLTNDQKKSIIEIEKKLNLGFNINILLQGDVGAGKTVVVVYFLLKAYLSGYKSIIMAPTEVLAKQHFNSITKLLENLNPRIIFIRGGNYKGKKDDLLLLDDEKPAIVIGTHALFQKNIKYSSTAITIIDEQHRFGVKQRMELIKLSNCPNVIVMSATPIPRTLSLTVYGDMDYSVIKEKPAERIKIKTFVRSEESLFKIYEFIKKRVDYGEKCFIITPLVDESDKLELKSAIATYEDLSTNVFKNYSVGLLHGRMKEKEKNKVMEDLKEGKVNILVSTTVIEVGVDISDATVIVINHADRFGIAQLHQLRGRVGRGNKPSYCVLVHSNEISKTTMKRLRILENSDDGFYLAEADLLLRGSGELLGSRQHGFGLFRFVDPAEDRELIEQVKKEVNALIKIEKIENIDKKLLDYVYEKHLKDYSIL
ncbi:MAG: ATP-dependent DNA helicase RecG [Candidatus Muirbacterium halophilum]|nr:ATP-dependent DNA helicase RecG [Candidatus Muirbacterium halophilum]